jgi:hypothetical protein
VLPNSINMHYVKIGFLTIIAVLLYVSCQNKSGTDTVDQASADSTSIALTGNTKISISLDSLKNFKGKKLQTDGLFKQFEILPRLKKLMGIDFDDFTEGWGDESVLMKEGEVMYATACKSKDCKSLKVLLVIDGLSNNLNVYLFNNHKIKTFEEANIIGLTETIGAQYEKLRDEQQAK